MNCQLIWGNCRNPRPYATVFCASCMAPIEYGIEVTQVRERIQALRQQHLCRREHAIPVGPRPSPAPGAQGRLFR